MFLNQGIHEHRSLEKKQDDQRKNKNISFENFSFKFNYWHEDINLEDWIVMTNEDVSQS